MLLIALVTTNVYFRCADLLASARKSASNALADQYSDDCRAGRLCVFLMVNVSSIHRSSPLSEGCWLMRLSTSSLVAPHHEHEHPWWQYIYWLIQEESPVLALALWARRSAFGAHESPAVFLALVFRFCLRRIRLLDTFKMGTIGSRRPGSSHFIVPGIDRRYAFETAYQKAARV